MTSVLHVLSAPGDPARWDMIDLLQKRAGDGFEHSICCLDAHTARQLGAFRGMKPIVARSRGWPFSMGSRALSEAAAKSGARIVHAWDIRAARVASTQLRDTAQVLTMIDPGMCARGARWLRSLTGRQAVIAGNQAARRELLAGGIDPAGVVVIRGAVDFAVINEARRDSMREKLALGGGPVILMHGPASHDGGQFQGLWAAAIVRQIYRDVRVISPYSGREAARLRRFVHSIGYDEMLISVDERWSWPQLAACADLFMAPALKDISTEPIAAAMAAGLVIVGTATRSITELIADRSNGLLVRSAEPTALAARILSGIEDNDLRRRVSDAARAQAYELFGVRAFLDHYAMVYENLLNGRSVGQGVVDTAMAA